MNKQIPRIIVAALAALIFYIAIMFVYHSLTTGRVSVKVDDSRGQVNILSVKEYEAGGEKNYKKSGQAKLTKRLKPGTYIVVAYTKSSYTNQAITLKARQDLKLNLILRATKTNEPILNNILQTGIQVNSRDLKYVNASGGVLTRVDSNGMTELTTVSFKSVRWDGLGQGVAEDVNQNLYFIGANNSVDKMNLPFSSKNNPSISFDISEKGVVYVTNGQNVYKKEGEIFKPLYSAGKGYVASLEAGLDRVAILVKQDPGLSNLVVLEGAGTKIRQQDSIKAFSWSPNGKLLVVAPDKGSPVIYDQQLNKKYVLPAIDVIGFGWINQGSLLYISKNSIWRYETGGQTSYALANISPAKEISGPYISQGGEYAYYSFTDGQLSRLMRVGLEDQAINNSVDLLAAFLPEKIGVCTIDYINFKQPVINVSFPSYEIDPQQCSDAAKHELKYYGVNPDLYEYHVDRVLRR